MNRTEKRLEEVRSDVMMSVTSRVFCPGNTSSALSFVCFSLSLSLSLSVCVCVCRRRHPLHLLRLFLRIKVRFTNPFTIVYLVNMFSLFSFHVLLSFSSTSSLSLSFSVCVLNTSLCVCVGA